VLVNGKNKQFILGQKIQYIRNIVEKFCLKDCKLVSTPIKKSCKFFREMEPGSKVKIDLMSRVPNKSALKSCIYKMICIGTNISYVVGMTSKFTSHLG
jgi:hypothetical protein